MGRLEIFPKGSVDVFRQIYPGGESLFVASWPKTWLVLELMDSKKRRGPFYLSLILSISCFTRSVPATKRNTTHEEKQRPFRWNQRTQPG